jgi:hypothetical protein
MLQITAIWDVTQFSMVHEYQISEEPAASNFRVNSENQYIIYHITSQCCIPDDNNLHSTHQESLKCGIYVESFITEYFFSHI